VWAGGPRATLAELRRRQGKTDEARRLLDECSGSAKGQLCRARLALDEGDSRLALELSERVCRNIADDRPVDRVPSLVVMARAQLALGDLEATERTRDQLTTIADLIRTEALTASVRAVDGALATARGDADRARPILEDAIDGFERCRAQFDAACARLDLAAALKALGRDRDAQREAKRAHEQLTNLGATVAAARAEPFLADDGKSTSASPSPISKRETEVLALVVEGMTNREIGKALHISEHTVHRHVNSILRKLDVTSRTAAAALALREGLVSRP
jgi:DNA-binding NarL/FixJ family response regulator